MHLKIIAVGLFVLAADIAGLIPIHDPWFAILLVWWIFSSATAGAAGQWTFTIINYAGTTFNKAFMVVGECVGTPGTANSYQLKIVHGLWRSTAAITSIVLGDLAGGNFVTGSTFCLYGVT